MGRPKLDAESLRLRHKRILELSQRGVPIAEIAATFGITDRSVKRIRARYGLSKPAPKRMSPAEIAQAERMLDDGASFLEVARTLQRHPSVIQRRFPGRGWTLKQCGEHAAFLRSIGEV
jgi:transposase